MSSCLSEALQDKSGSQSYSSEKIQVFSILLHLRCCIGIKFSSVKIQFWKDSSLARNWNKGTGQRGYWHVSRLHVSGGPNPDKNELSGIIGVVHCTDINNINIGCHLFLLSPSLRLLLSLTLPLVLWDPRIMISTSQLSSPICWTTLRLCLLLLSKGHIIIISTWLFPDLEMPIAKKGVFSGDSLQSPCHVLFKSRQYSRL